MNNYKKILFLQSMIIFIILITIFIINYIIDPYSLNNKFNISLDKNKIVSIMDRRLYKIAQYIKDPKQIIVFGDSRGDSLRSDFFICDIFNISYGGGTLYEAIDTFWFIVNNYKISHAVFVVPFNIFDDNNSMNLVGQAISIINNPVGYYLNINTIKSSFFILIDKFFNKNMVSEKPKLDKIAFWQQQLSKEVTGRFYAFRRKPVNIIKKIEDIKKYCEKNKIKLIFIFPPTHVTLQNKIGEYNLIQEYVLYKNYFKRSGLLLDYDVISDITINYCNFNDPYHFTENVARIIAKDISKLF